MYFSLLPLLRFPLQAFIKACKPAKSHKEALAQWKASATRAKIIDGMSKAKKTKKITPRAEKGGSSKDPVKGLAGKGAIVVPEGKQSVSEDGEDLMMTPEAKRGRSEFSVGSASAQKHPAKPPNIADMQAPHNWRSGKKEDPSRERPLT